MADDAPTAKEGWSRRARKRAQVRKIVHESTQESVVKRARVGSTLDDVDDLGELQEPLVDLDATSPPLSAECNMIGDSNEGMP